VRGSVANQDLAGDISAVMALVEADGFDVNMFLAKNALKGSLRNLRDTQGGPAFLSEHAGRHTIHFVG
jgi:hypothetical protein